MKKQIITAILFILWAGLFSQESYIQLNAGNLSGRSNFNMTVNDASTQSYNPAVFAEYIDHWAPEANVPGMSVCVLKNGKLYWVYHYGLANIAQNKPVDDSSCFYLASISKTVVQTAIMQLWEQDYFELNDYVGDYLTFPVVHPNYPDSIINFFKLMTHTSSIVSDNLWGWSPFNQFMPGFFTPGGAYYSTANFIEDAPGTVWSYSNVGNSLLGYLTQEMAGLDYSEYCEEHIFQPLGITNGSYFLANLNPANLVTQYYYSGGTYYPATTPDGGGPIYPAAVLKISAIELSKFLGMYMQQGTFNGSTILYPETVELITTPTSWGGALNSKQCLTWLLREDMNMIWHSGGTDASSTFAGYDKDDQWGVIVLMNAGISVSPWWNIFRNFPYFACLYNPISVASITVNDADGDGVIEANEEFELGLTLRNDINFPDVAENVMATISVNNPYVTLISDSVVDLGSLNYLEEIQLPADQFLFSVNWNLEPGDIEFQLHFTWEGGNEYTTTCSLFGGHADVLLVRDEETVSVAWNNGLKEIREYYRQSLTSLEYITHYWDLEVMGDPAPGFINNLPAVIWFTGSDAENTISENNQLLLAGYLDNGGQLFMSGQNISDELAGTAFLQNYLHAEHLQDNIGTNFIVGIANDPIGNGQQYQLNFGDAMENQYSKSVIGPLDGAFKVFHYYGSEDNGAAIRYENETFKTVFFAFGFEAIDGTNNRQEILGRILNDYFIMPHPCLPGGITFTTQEEIDNFQIIYPDCIEIEGDVTINGPGIDNLNGLNVLTVIGGDLQIGENTGSNPMLTSLTGLNNVTSIGGSLGIGYNDGLTSLTGLSNVLFVGGDAEFVGNAALTSLTGLDNLNSIGGDLGIVHNTSLTDLTGLENIEPGSIGDLSIYYNFSLSSCDVWSICEYLTAPNGEVEIHDNEPGCNSQEEVELACWSPVPEKILDGLFSISPNPLRSTIMIEYNLPQNQPVTLRILDLTGYELATLVNEAQQQGEQRVVFSTEGLKPGIYLCVLKTNGKVQTEKMIKL